MTGAAALAAPVLGAPGTPVHQAAWDLRAVNGRTLDLRLRLPEGLDGLESGLRARLGARIKRGSVSLALRLTRADDGSAALRPDPVALAAALAAVAQVQQAAEEAGVALRPPTAAEVLGLRGVLALGPDPGPVEPLVAALLAQAEALIDRFDAARAAEGAALAATLAAQLAAAAALVAEARALLPARAADQAQGIRAALERILSQIAADPARLEQELALLAVRSDVTEELDRIHTHVQAARRLLAQAEPAGRQFDFLTQEFNREANTLCSKAQHAGLARIGLELKTLIDQMREQAANLE